MKNVILLKLMLVILLAACSPPSATPTETLAPTDTPTATQTQPTATKVKPTATPTLPTPTRKPTFTPTITETLPPPRDPPLVVAYIKAGDVYLWREGVGSIRLTSDMSSQGVQISDDGSRIAFSAIAPEISDYHENLWAVNSDGSDLRLLVGVDELKVFPTPDGYSSDFEPVNVVYQFEFLPGTHTLVYNTSALYWEAYWSHDDLYSVDVDTLEKNILLEPGLAGFFSISPDGSKIALSNFEEVLLLNADGSNRRRVLTFPIVYLSGMSAEFIPDIEWKTDSSSFITIILPEYPKNDPPETTKVFRVTSKGYTTKIHEFIYVPGEWYIPVFISPDTTRILYSSNWDYETNTFHLHEAGLDGSYDNVISIDAVNLYGWAPDSQHLLYENNRGEALQYGTTQDGFASFPERVSNIYGRIIWVDDDRFLYIRHISDSYELRLDDTSGNSILIDTWMEDYYSASFDATHIQK
jgi:hypothetical protein